MYDDPLEKARLIAGYIQGTLSEQEESQFLDLLERDKNLQDTLEMYKDTPTIASRIKTLKERDTEKAWNRFKEKANKGSRRRINSFWISIAAGIALFLTFTLKHFNHRDNKVIPDSSHRYANDVLPGESKAKLVLSDGSAIHLGSKSVALNEHDGTNMQGTKEELIYRGEKASAARLIYNTLFVPPGGNYRLTLPDGTKVWLNAASKLVFPVSFANNERLVTLEGEAYFEVARDKKRPFKVTMNDTKITVLGTSFNARSYEKESMTTLVSGAVKVHYGSSLYDLKPGQCAVADGNDLNIGTADIEKALAWKEGHFLFNEDAIKPILEEVARWYDLELSYKGKLPDIHIGGSISRKERLSEVLEMLKEVSGLNFNVNGRKLQIIANPS